MQKNYNIGLKLWSINTDYYYTEAKKLYSQGYFDYIELYVVPNTLDKTCKWKELNIPFILHAPHFVHEVNLADKDKFNYNKEIYAQVEIYRQELNARYTVVHAGTMGNIEETARQLNRIAPINMLIENKPFYPPHYEDRRCRGATFEEIEFILHQVDCGFCLDVSHAVCTANALSLPVYEYLKKFNALEPKMYHLCDGISSSAHDLHLHIGQGDYDFSKIFSIINGNKPISVETQKDSKVNLNDFILDAEKIYAA